MTLTKEFIRNKLQNDDVWLLRGVCAINERQTFDERRDETTKYRNNWGFRPSDARFLGSIAHLVESKCKLTEKQLYSTRKKMDKYAGQLLKLAKIKAEC